MGFASGISRLTFPIARCRAQKCQEFAVYNWSGGSTLGRLALGGRRRRVQAHQVQFAPVQQFPLDLVAGLEANGGGQGQWKTHVEPGLLSFGADGLDLQRIGVRLHFFVFFEIKCLTLVS